MPMVMIDLLGASAGIEGQVARRLVEVRPGLYVGSLSRRTLELLWDAVVASHPKAAVLVYPAKTEMGCAFKSVGECRYEIVSNFGLPLVRFKTVAKIGSDGKIA